MAQSWGLFILAIVLVAPGGVQGLAQRASTACGNRPSIIKTRSSIKPSSRMEHINCGHPNRRALLSKSLFIASLVGSSLASSPFPGIAQDRPFGPTEALLPAARVKLTIDRAVELAKKINMSMTESKYIDSSALRELEDLILKPQNYVGSLVLQGVPSMPAKQYLEGYKAMPGDLPLQRFLIKNGDVSTWKDLKRREKKEESTNEIRAAFNAYTDALSFSGNSYVLNVDKRTQSKMIREDRLPELKQVVTSDMGVRYLYRNQILTAMDDVRAELDYQLSSEDQFFLEDLLDLLIEAQRSCERWFDLIEPNEVQNAINTVQKEMRLK